ncbi:MAG: MerR family transcriptional regulator [Moraxellaceae bacterium]|jgi:MerR family mercuric resistance operon transcriptional regulator|nr:MerR family transcriptional regulator [Moraxellaceae bacterium]MBP9046511.1 MerR family transcriptional regulator [Moraxellaceae bacterium]MBP9731043.1 MerR family transcriptional regulator [Moraxellaceae bacterium]HQV42246.1 MerR family transcriptional regulator [Moraxellaceae bacterium]HQX90411.1 MerR family transcriptional regulator [Moraxellaceae bacterium]
MAGMTIGKLAAQASVNVETVRYYHRIGLLTEPVREGAYRYYCDEDLQHLHFIRRAKEAGFSLEEIRELLHLDAVKDRGRIRAMASIRLQDIQTRIQDMQMLAARLQNLIGQCADEKAHACCPIVETFKN